MLGWLFGRTPEESEPVKPKAAKWQIRLHGPLPSAPQQAAWTVYAGAKAMVRDGRYAELNPEARGRDGPFDEECYARDALAEFWGAQPAALQGLDPYLRLMARVRAAGLVREYVWRFLREDGWAEPAGLDHGRLDGWLAAEGATAHRPETRASLAPG